MLKPTLEGIVTRYRREVASAGAHAELEIRILDVDYQTFSAIYAALLEKKPEEVKVLGITQMVSAIMDIRENAPRQLRPMQIREIFFENGAKVRQQFVRKEPLLPSYRVPSATALSYLVALSSEKPDREFSLDEGAIIRVKARSSFALRVGQFDWRVDMTVTRQIAGSDAKSALPSITDKMFRKMGPETFLAAFAEPGVYRYEVEAELVAAASALAPGDVTAAAEAILRLANPEYVREAALQECVYFVATHFVTAPAYLRRFAHEFGLKRLLPQALAITRADYRAIYPPTGMWLTDKADGTRAVGLVRDGRGFVVTDKLYTYSEQKGAETTILDGEYVHPNFYAFDVIAVAGEVLAGEPFEKRVTRLANGVRALVAAGVPAVAKEYVHVSGSTPAELERDFRAVLEAKRPYDVDGVIIVEPGKPYVETANYKWKGAEHNTIDCLARRAPPTVLGRSPFVDKPGHKLYFLFVGINQELYDALGLQLCPGYTDLFGEDMRRNTEPRQHFPVQFSPSDAPLAYLWHRPDNPEEVDGKVVEVRLVKGNWEALRVREDRRGIRHYYGNDFYTAELIWLNYVDPFPVEQLWTGAGDDYFMQPKAGIYKAQTAVISFVKEQRIASLKHVNWVVDVGAGQGQDLGRYLRAEVKHLVAVDKDKAALTELVRRRYDFAKKPDTAGKRRGAGTTVYTLATDAGAPHLEVLRKLEALGVPPGGADAFVCNLAVHYFCSSVESIRNFAALARGCVKPGGAVVLTVLLGEAVHTLLRALPEGGTWEIREDDARKYSIRRMYRSASLEAAGQRIGVLLPFSQGQYYEEFLVNTGALVNEFRTYGFELVTRAEVSKSLPEFEAQNKKMFDQLTPGDKQYLSLYAEICFQAKAPPAATLKK